MRLAAFIFVLVGGALVAAQPAANHLLSRHVGALGAAFFSLLLSLSLITVLLVVAGDVGQLRHVTEYEPRFLFGGLAGAVIVSAGIYAVRPLGAGGVAAVTVASQLIVSVLIDRYGWLGVEQRAIDTQAVAGVALLIGGALLVTLR